MMIAKAGRPERAPSNMSSIPTRRRRGSENCGHLAEPGSENCPAATRFPTMQLVLPPMMAAKMHDDPQVTWEMTPWYRCWWWAPWELPRLLGVSPLPLIPLVSSVARKEPGREIWSQVSILVFEAYKTKYCIIKLTQKNIFWGIQYFIVPDFTDMGLNDGARW